MSLKDAESGVSMSDSVTSPGRLIAAARESRSISPVDLALRLRLDGKMVKALERDDFENFPAPTFVRGYIRSISKELGVDADPILEAYATHASGEPPSLADFSSRAPDQIGINSTVIKVVTYVLLTTLILLIVFWWRSTYERGEATPVGELGESIDAHTTKADPLPYKYQVLEHDNEGWRVAPPAEPSTADGVVVTDLPADGGEDNPEPDLAAVGTLHISTSNEAWIEVYSAADDRLYYGTAKADSTVEIAGHAYYRLILGNTESVTLRLNGEKIDLGPYSYQGVAQLELGSPPQNDSNVQ